MSCSWRGPCSGNEKRNRRDAAGSPKSMRYWSFFAAKLLGAAGLMAGLWRLLVAVLPAPEPFMSYPVSRWQDFRWTMVLFAFSLVCAGLLALIAADQKYRCRTCLRRLRMPLSAGSWTNSFLHSEPRLEYICTYGHGTLRVAELQIAGLRLPKWRANEDIWTELKELEQSRR